MSYTFSETRSKKRYVTRPQYGLIWRLILDNEERHRDFLYRSRMKKRLSPVERAIVRDIYGKGMARKAAQEKYALTEREMETTISRVNRRLGYYATSEESGLRQVFTRQND